MASVHLQSVIRLLTLKGNDDYSIIVNGESITTDDPDDTIITPVNDSILSFEGRYTKSEINGTTVLNNDVKLYVDPSSLSSAPTKTDQMTDGTDTYSIENITRFKDNDTIVLYIFQLRR